MKKLALALCASAFVVMAAPSFAEDAAPAAMDATAATQAADATQDNNAVAPGSNQTHKAVHKRHAHKKHKAKKVTPDNADNTSAAPESNDSAATQQN